MKTKKRTKAIGLGIVCIIIIIIGISLSLNANKVITADATETIHNTTLNVDEVKIDGWRTIRDMTIYGPNNDFGCGMTAMAILLQYYNDNSLYAGEILPDDLNYASNNIGQQARANALRGDENSLRNDDLFHLTPRFLGSIGDWIGAENATVPVNHKNGLNSFFQIHCPQLDISATYSDTGIHPGGSVLGAAVNSIGLRDGGLRWSKGR